MKPRFTVTYDIVTPESAEQGDAAEYGFILPNGSHLETGEAQAELGDNWRNLWPPQSARMTLREAVEHIGVLDSAGSGSSFYEADGTHHYGTGDHETRALHCSDNITAASYRRIARFLDVTP